MPWPKTRPALSVEDVSINEDWQLHWLTISQNQFSAVQRSNHGYVLKAGIDLGTPILEVGAGGGQHLCLELGRGTRPQDYRVLELRSDLARITAERFPGVQVDVGDCQKRLPFESASLGRIVAIHVMEHLEDLPSFLDEASRVLRPDGRLLAVIPCEGGIGYHLGRRVTSQRLFEGRYKRPYGPFIRLEHLSTAREILAALPQRFRVESSTWWPLRIPSVDLNLCVGLRLAPLTTNTSR